MDFFRDTPISTDPAVSQATKDLHQRVQSQAAINNQIDVVKSIQNTMAKTPDPAMKAQASGDLDAAVKKLSQMQRDAGLKPVDDRPAALQGPSLDRYAAASREAAKFAETPHLFGDTEKERKEAYTKIAMELNAAKAEAGIEGGHTLDTKGISKMSKEDAKKILENAEGIQIAAKAQKKMQEQWDNRDNVTMEQLKEAENEYLKTEKEIYGDANKKELIYDYDHQNRLVRRKADNDGNGTIDQTDVYVHDGYQIALQFSAATSGTLATTNLTRRYLWGVNPDELLADETVSTTATASKVLWTTGDHLGSVRDILRYNGSATSVANHLTYNAFGILVSKSSVTAVDNTMFAFTGKWTDAVSALQWNLNRWYDALVGKWISEDPIGFDGKDVNLYRYVGNNSTV